ncbi:glycosyltransferase [Flavobacterium sp. WC2421]|uniref:Glycosyltransferase n=1 Tax=Flavobacterium sp. WC2416 TaxID=3234141 RepID=A0AB39WHB9_9FLAO
MQDKALVTIICLCYNQEAFVLESLESVIKQEYKNIELIIIDDCSTDNSKTTIEKWIVDHPEVQFITNKTNLGITKAFNKGLKLAKGTYIIDLAADDVLLPNCVSLQVNTFKNSNYKNLGVVYGNAALITKKGLLDSYYFAVNKDKKVTQKRITGDIYTSVLAGGDSICSVSSMTKKSVYDVLDGYDENLAYEDLDFWIRASRIYAFDFIDEILIQKRIVSNSMATDFYKKKNKINHSTYVILKKAIGLNRSKIENKTVLKRIHFEMILAYKNLDFVLLVKYIFLEIRIRISIL